MDITPLRHGAVGKKITQGSHATIHRIKTPSHTFTQFIVKIGKTDEYSPPFLHWLHINLSRKKVSGFLEKFLGPEFKINPDAQFIINGFTQYRLIKTYFGCEGTKNIRIKILADLYDHASSFYQELLDILPDAAVYKKIIRIFSAYTNENFLPREHVIIGHPPHLSQEDTKAYGIQGKKLPLTYYLFQEYIQGIPLYQMNHQELTRHPKLAEKLLVFAILAKRMYHDTGMLIDTRPEEIAKHPCEWFGKTANIIVNTNTEAIFFVDTRWLWSNQNRLIGKNGLNLIEHLGLRSVDRAIATYARMLTQ
ncbi:MAG: hypothetical protein Q8R40_07115 [bacterium]|nr:hypothetical protein [bacterium]